MSLEKIKVLEKLYSGSHREFIFLEADLDLFTTIQTMQDLGQYI